MQKQKAPEISGNDVYGKISMNKEQDTGTNCTCNLFRFNLITENFSQTLAFPPDSYKKGNVTYHFKKHGRMIQVSFTGNFTIPQYM